MSQQVIVAQNSFNRIAAFILQKRFSKPLIIAGTHLPSNDIEAFNAEKEVKLIRVADGLLTKELADELLNQISFEPDVIIAIGGGRILDAAKLVMHSAKWPSPFFIAVPTTAGSGSEATPFAVMYEGFEKHSISHENLLPQLVVLDNSLLSNLPVYQKAVSGIDALAQSIESLWNVNATAESKLYATQALEILWSELPAFVQQNDVEINKRMQWAAYLAGKAIAITRTTGCHALSYYLTAKHHIPHGHAVSLFLPLFFLYNRPASLAEIFAVLKVENADEAFVKIKGLMQDCGLSTTFSALDIEVDMEMLLLSVNAERFANNPVPFNKDRLKKLIQEHLT